MNKRKTGGLAALLILGLAACGSTTADSVGLHYNGGPFEGQSFNRMIEPGSGSEFLGPGDSLVRIEINKREYTFCPDVRPEPDEDGCDGGPIVVTARGGAEIAFSGGLSFVINTYDEEAVRSFNEELCRKFDCADDGGFNLSGLAELYRVNVRGPFEDALQEISRNYTVDEIYAGVPRAGGTEEAALSTLTEITNQAEEQLRDTINEYAGGTFFCGPSFDRNAEEFTCPSLELVITEVTPSEAIRDAFDRNVSSQQAIIDTLRAADAERAEAQGEADAAQIRATIAAIPGYIAYLRAQAMVACAANPQCTLIVSDGGSDVNVNAGRAPQ